MSDEEKKAIESFKEENNNDLSRFDDFNSYTQFKVKRDKIIIDLIEKQSKEIEELKEDNKKLDKENQSLFEAYNFNDTNLLAKILKEYRKEIKDSIPNDKIKAKIEEVKDGTYDAKIVLQSLLQEEEINEC